MKQRHSRSLLRFLGLVFILLLPSACQTGMVETTISEPTQTSSYSIFQPVPTSTEAPVATEITTADPLRFVFPTPGVEPVSSWRPPLYPTPWAPSPYDHFYFSRPIAADEINWPLANYRYGGVSEKGYTHTGVDIPSPANTPVLAAGPGTVVWADWGLYSGLPNNRNDPLGKAVVIRHDFGYNDLPLFTVYAHLKEIEVTVGQWLDTGDVLGKVGETGHATAPHLHFEVRIGENDNFSTRNPELWLVPPEGWGVLVAHIGDLFSEPLDNVLVTVQSLTTGQYWYVQTYRHYAVNRDPYYRENMVLSDLPAGRYTVRVPYRTYIYVTEIEIFPGQVTYFTFRGFLKFFSDPPMTPMFEIPFTTPVP